MKRDCFVVAVLKEGDVYAGVLSLDIFKTYQKVEDAISIAKIEDEKNGDVYHYRVHSMRFK